MTFMQYGACFIRLNRKAFIFVDDSYLGRECERVKQTDIIELRLRAFVLSRKYGLNARSVLKAYGVVSHE